LILDFEAKNFRVIHSVSNPDFFLYGFYASFLL